MAAVNRVQIAERIRLVLKSSIYGRGSISCLNDVEGERSGEANRVSGPYGLTEVPAVSLSAHEQRTLSGIADELAASDPKLASILSVFNRLTRGEELPIRHDSDKSRRRDSGRTRKHRRTAGLAWRAIAVWILISAALITVGIMLSHIGHGTDGRWRCTQSWVVSCAGP
jgi:hypothetical protein